VDALFAVFPQARSQARRKIRAMQIINEMESAGAASYGGASAYFRLNGDLDTWHFALRTAIIRYGQLHIQGWRAGS